MKGGDAMTRVTKRDLESGRKRVNMSLSIPEFDDLNLVAEYQKIDFTTLAHSWVTVRARDEAGKIRKTDYVPESQRGLNLFTPIAKTKGKKF